MRILLTSFGVSKDGFLTRLPLPTQGATTSEELADRELHGYTSFQFVQMPPVDMRETRDKFVPDYATILLADELLMDEESFDALVSRSHPVYAEVADIIRELKISGFVTLVNYRAILRRNEDLLRVMLENDLLSIDPWIDSLRSSIELWHRFTMQSGILSDYLRNMVRHAGDTHLTSLDAAHLSVSGGAHGFRTPTDEAYLLRLLLEKPKSRRTAAERDTIKVVLAQYLDYVNANLIIARDLKAGFHDWADYAPFYYRKFLGIGQEEVQTEAHAEQVRQLFSIPFPELAIRNAKHLMAVLQDHRIDDLRRLVADAAEGKVVFDDAFAKDTLKGVLGEQNIVSKWRMVTSFITKPFGRVPFVGPMLEAAAEAVVKKYIDSTQREFRWYYMLSEAASAKPL